MRALVIGTGRIGSSFDELKEKDWTNTHIGVYKKNSRIREIAICDKNPKALQRAKKFWHIKKAYSNIDIALKEFSPSVVSICAKPAQTLSILEEVAKYNSVRYIWFEKPFSDSLKNGLKQIRILKNKKIRFITNYQRRFDPFYVYVKNNLHSLIGKPLKCACFFSGGILNTASHLVNLLMYYFGTPVSSKPMSIKPDNKGDFHGDFRVNFKGLSAYLFEINCQTSALSGGYSIFEALILGEKGRIDLNSMPLNEYDFRYYLKGQSRFKGIPVLKEKDMHLDYKRDYMERGLSALLTKRRSADTEETVETLKVFKDLDIIN